MLNVTHTHIHTKTNIHIMFLKCVHNVFTFFVLFLHFFLQFRCFAFDFCWLWRAHRFSRRLNQRKAKTMMENWTQEFIRNVVIDWHLCTKSYRKLWRTWMKFRIFVKWFEAFIKMKKPFSMEMWKWWTKNEKKKNR